jgi:ribosome-binding protein aMBF1 (putative translation factor)
MLAGLVRSIQLPKSLRSRRHRALLAVLVGSRKEAGLTQRQVAAKWKRPQSTVAAIESGERRLDVAEFFELAEALGVDPVALFERVARW